MMSKANRRYLRSVLMLVAAMGVMVWTAVDLFSNPNADMRALFIGTAIGVGAVIVTAAVILMLVMALRRLITKSR
jgi:hypothetical protein